MVTTQFWAGAGNCLTPITPKFFGFSSGSPNLKIVKILLPTGILGRGDNMRKIHLKNSFSMAPHWWHAAHHHIPQLFVARIRLRSRSWGVEWDGWNHLKNHLFTKQLATSNFIAGYICAPYKQNSFPPGNTAMSSPKVKGVSVLPDLLDPVVPLLFTLQGNDHISYSWKMENNHQIIIENQIQQLKKCCPSLRGERDCSQECHSFYQMCSDRFGGISPVMSYIGWL